MTELAEKIISMVDGERRRSSITRCPPTIRRNRQPTIDQAREVLGWQPKDRARPPGLERTIDYFRQHLAEHPIC